MTTPRLSIIIATYNAAATLERCFDSTFEQSFVDWEVLVADGGSTDGTLAIIESRKERIAYWHSRSDRGIYDAWNQVLEHARGEYVCFLGADDAWRHSDSLDRIFHAIGRDKPDLVTGRGRVVDAQGLPKCEIGNPWSYRKASRRINICHPGALHRKDLFLEYGHFDSSYRIAADYEFLLRLPPTVRTLHVDQALIDVGDTGISRRQLWQTLRERYRAQAGCPRIGRLRAIVNLADKLWRIPVGRMLGIPT